MCHTSLFQNLKCKHSWAIITEPCGPGMGFLTCDTFGTSTVKQAPMICLTRARPCPKCLRDKHGCWSDPNTIRIVESFGSGVKWGTGPKQEDWGCELKFKDGACVVL